MGPLLALFAFSLSLLQNSGDQTRTWTVTVQLQFCGCILYSVESRGPRSVSSDAPLLAQRTDYSFQWDFVPDLKRPYATSEIMYRLLEGSGYWKLRVTVRSLQTGELLVKDIWVSPLGIAVGEEPLPVPVPDADREVWLAWARSHDYSTSDFAKQIAKLYYSKDSGIILPLWINVEPGCEEEGQKKATVTVSAILR